MVDIAEETKKLDKKPGAKKRSDGGVRLSPARLKKMIRILMTKLETEENSGKASVSELLKLLQVYKELTADQVKEVEVRWVDRLPPDEEPGNRVRRSSLQAKFHRLKSRFKGFSGPVGSGKSQALCQEAIRLSYMNAGRLGLLGAPTFPMLRDATQAALFEILERCDIPYEWNKAENYIVFTEVGSKVLFRSLDDFERLRGTNLAWFGIDELTYCQEEAWLRLEARLRDPRAKLLCGYGVWTPKGFDWVYRRFIAEPVEGYGVVLAKAHENRHLLDQIPDFYERLKRSYDERFYQQEVLGQYLNVTAGRAYSAFDRMENVQREHYDPRYPLLWALDFNVNPMCSVVAQRDGDRIRVLDEIVLSRVTTEEACMEFVRRYPDAQKVIIYGDASEAGCRPLDRAITR